MAGHSTDPGRSVTSKVTAILMVFADGDEHTLTEIAAAADLPTSTAHRLASELVAWRLLERTEERSYRCCTNCPARPATRCDWALFVVQMS